VFQFLFINLASVSRADGIQLPHFGKPCSLVQENFSLQKRLPAIMIFFKVEIEIIGINPFVFVPDKILRELFKQAGKSKGHIPIHGTINGQQYKQTLVKYKGDWRLYINTFMLKNSPKRIGEMIEISLEFDPSDRSVKPHPKLTTAFKKNPSAKKMFDKLSPSRQKEIIRYISFLKTEESIERNVKRTIAFLSGKTKFVGRDKP
jgi:hypothetical protein